MAIFSTPERQILRDLAKRVKDIADNPVMADRRDRWLQHNTLRSKEPMMLIFPEGAWCELLPEEALLCSDQTARQIELDLRMRIYTFEHFQDDSVIEAEWIVPKKINSTGWGLEPRWIASPGKRGSFHFDPVIKTAEDLKKLRQPEISYDEKTSLQHLSDMQYLFGDILNVSLQGIKYLSYHLMNQYTALRGLEEVMIDMYAEPQMLHDAMAFYQQAHHDILKQYIAQNLLSFNNDNAYQGTGGNGFTDELPLKDADPQHARPQDMWASAEAQELAQVSPEQHLEFSLQYEKPLLEPFGLTAYGCCEDLTRKLDDVFDVPHIRRISISPYSNVDLCAPKLKDDYIFSWKPNPSYLVGPFDSEIIRNYIQHAVDVADQNDCVFEIVLKDTHTCEFHPERFDQWTKIARDAIESKIA